MGKKFTTDPFDLEKAKAGEPVCTRDGKDVRIICWDRIKAQPIVALVKENGEEVAFGYNENGTFSTDETPYVLDLMMKVEVKESYVFAEDWKGTLVPVDELGCSFLESEIPDIDYLIIKTHDGKYLKIWKHNLPEAEFDAAQKAATEIGEGWRCPTRRECIDIYDARFKGLDEAMKEIGGDKLKECYWTCEADSDPQYYGDHAVCFSGCYGDLDNHFKYGKCSVRPVLAFEIEDNSAIE